MRIRTTVVPFSEIVGPEATEVEFDPTTDYLVLRSLFAFPRAEVREFADRLGGIGEDTTEDEAVDLTLEVIRRTVVEWHLVGTDEKPVPKPTSADDLEALPGAVRTALFPYLATFRGRPDPTPAA